MSDRSDRAGEDRRHRAVAWIGIGSNLDNPARHVADALATLADGAEPRLLARSRCYRTVPVGGPADQPMFCNAAAAVATTRDAPALLSYLQAIESAHGRIRDVRWGPRTLDLDIIAYDDRRSADPRLTLPHPRAHERAFVLVPLAEIAPALSLGPAGRVIDCLARVDANDIAPWRGAG
ncbi:2-amino-4-hydroxy-6-hydroxymethyldihydropteridine diphosphokinase [Salinisphaera sp. Q1T1-3]|uniref:2-amino-4-hydroxy-6- hydroxymethyldihydropteridine diphosphokinase n=1 Tax=Salinisphaera sp. Q1T1-3 TaxID=2321229 RepID=UPI000E71B35D|nr:2-amino-4-hydroxy-6-hydroxymethyldihydropteridine diphosphokinase [Salinisphaera sp. Q1T1-3]RJS93781.1 2-amino-4-hydroxy-6-hydroxymethyldihydropteridine diphosphokinase [Salinisphaera sp. Q1T1-3]